MWQPPASERLRAAKRSRVLLWVALAAFAFAAVMGVIVVVTSPAVWWEWLIAFVAVGFVVVRNVQRLRAINKALPGIEAEIRAQDHASAATAPGK